MLRRLSAISALGFITAFAAWAQSEVAVVTSATTFTLRGVSIDPNLGVHTWPVLSGDFVESGSTLTTITFQDGSTVTLAGNSRAKIFVADNKPVFQLTKGTATYTLKAKDAVTLVMDGGVVTPDTLAGVLVPSSSAAAAAGFWTPIHTIGVVGVAAGGVAALGVGLAVSPSR